MTPTPGPVAYAPSSGGYVAHQVTGGSGPHLVVLPTLTADFASYWELPAAADVLTQLAAHCRVVLLDRRGTGSSDPLQPGEVADAAAHAADVAAVLAHLDVDDAVVVGESYAGGPAALRVAAAVPGRVARVVVANLPLRPVLDELALDLDALVDQVLWGQEAGDHAVPELELTPSVRDDEAYAAWAERAGRATSPAVARGQWESMLTYELEQVVPEVRVPVTVLATGHWSAPPAGVTALAAALPDATVVDVPRVDTLLFVGDTRQLVAELLFAATGARHRTPPRRRLAAVLFTDLAGSTARAAELGDTAWRGLLDVHDRLVGELVAEHGGTLVKRTGDGALATFPLGSTAVGCATQLVARLGAVGLPARAGVHVGEVEWRDDDVGGLAVHVAARVAAAAAADQVLVTEAVRSTTMGSGRAFGRPVDHELRGVPGAWPLAPALD